MIVTYVVAVRVALHFDIFRVISKDVVVDLIVGRVLEKDAGTRVVAQGIVKDAIVARRKLIYVEPPKFAGIFLFPKKVNAFARVDDLIAAHFIFQTVENNDAVIVHVGNRVVFDDVAFGKTHPDAVNAVVQIVADDLIAGAKAQFNRVVHDVVNVIARDDIVVAARHTVRFDKNPVAVAAADFIIQNVIAARTILHRDAAGVTAGTDHARAPCAITHVAICRVAGNFAVGRFDQIDAPRGIVGRIIVADMNRVA